MIMLQSRKLLTNFMDCNIMKKTSIDTEHLVSCLKNKKIMTIDELKTTLRTQCRMTVLRKLTVVGYISSYSHSGKYYSLKRIARYNTYGIWSCQSAFFSQHGTLKNTIECLISSSTQGYTASELTRILNVKVEDVLLELVTTNTITRKKRSGMYVYYTTSPHVRKKQELTRVDRIQSANDAMRPAVSLHELKAALILFLSTLNEKQRRLYAGYESLKIGHGGDTRIAELLDVNPKTVARGRQELLGGTVNVERVREPGGGRKEIKKNSGCH